MHCSLSVCLSVSLSRTILTFQLCVIFINNVAFLCFNCIGYGVTKKKKNVTGKFCIGSSKFHDLLICHFLPLAPKSNQYYIMSLWLSSYLYTKRQFYDSMHFPDDCWNEAYFPMKRKKNIVGKEENAGYQIPSIWTSLKCCHILKLRVKLCFWPTLWELDWRKNPIGYQHFLLYPQCFQKFLSFCLGNAEAR